MAPACVTLVCKGCVRSPARRWRAFCWFSMSSRCCSPATTRSGSRPRRNWKRSSARDAASVSTFWIPSLAGLDALGSHVLPLLPVRIPPPATEADARKVLRENNTEGDYLITHGDGILNAASGIVEANERFKGALLSENERVARLRVMRGKADQAGFALVLRCSRATPPCRWTPRTRTSSGRSWRNRRGACAPSGRIPDVRRRRRGPGAEPRGWFQRASRRPWRAGDGADTEPASSLARAADAAVLSAAMTSAAIDVIDFMPVTTASTRH